MAGQGTPGRKGERTIKIRGFSTTKVTETDQDDTESGDESSNKTERQLRRFPILSVFDVSQTDPIEGPAQPENPARALRGEEPAGIFDAIAAHMRAQDWTVDLEDVPGETNGYTTDGTRRIVIDADLSPAQRAKTGLYEAGHATLHVDEAGQWSAAEPYVAAHRGRFECEAESVAYVLARMAGLDTSDYSVGYITTWTGGDVGAARVSAENVLRAVRALARWAPT